MVGVISPLELPAVPVDHAFAPALAAGNTVVHKPSEVTPVSALELPSGSPRKGIPDGVLNVVTGGRGRRGAGRAPPGRQDRLHRQRRGRPPRRSPPGGAGSPTGDAGARRQERQHRLRRRRPRPRRSRAARRNLRGGGADLRRGFAARWSTQSFYDQAARHAGSERRGCDQARRSALAAETQMGPGGDAVRSSPRTSSMIERQALAEGAEVPHGGVRREPRRASRQGLLLRAHDPAPRRQARNIIDQNEALRPVLSMTPFRDDDEVAALANATPLRPRRRHLDA